MSKLPRISAHNSDGYKSTLPYNQDSSTNESMTKLTQSEFPPIKNSNPQQHSTKFNNIIYDTKFGELESKLVSMEEANALLLNRLSVNERNFELQLKEVQIRVAEEKDHRFKAEKLLSMITDQTSLSSSDLKMKMDLLQEAVSKEDQFKGQQRERDIEMYKNLINKLTEKVSETVKMEVEARFKADIDNKMLTNNVVNKLETEIDLLRKEMSDLVSQTRLDIQLSTRECSERTHNVSKYIDLQISEAVFGKGSTSENLKNFVHKLTDQIKTNLISQNNQNDLVNSRLAQIEAVVPVVKEDFYAYITAVENRLIEKMKDVKMFAEVNITRCHQQLCEEIDELSKNTDKSLSFMAGQISDTRLKLNKQVVFIDQANVSRFKATCQDLQSITNRLYIYEDILNQFDKRNNDMRQKVTEDISQLRATYDVQIVNERIIHSIENNNTKEEIDKCKIAILNMGNSFNNEMGNMNKESGSVISNILQRINYLQDMQNMLAEKNMSMFDEFQKNLDQMDVDKVMTDMLFKVENVNILTTLQESKNKEAYLNDNMLNNQEYIRRNRDEITKLKDQLENLLRSFNDSGNILSRLQMDKEEAEREKEVHNMVERMISNAERLLDNTSENEQMLLRAISKVENKIVQHEQLNEREFTKLWRELGKEKPKEEGNVSPFADEAMVKNTLNQVLNNAEFNNIYAILEQLTDGGLPREHEAPKFTDTVSDQLDSKIAKALEKIRNDNVNMWTHAIQLTQKINQPDEIRKIIQTVPPVVFPISESLKRILDVDHYEYLPPRPAVPVLTKELRKVEKIRKLQMEQNIYDNYMRGPDKESTNEVADIKKSQVKGQSKGKEQPKTKTPSRQTPISHNASVNQGNGNSPNRNDDNISRNRSQNQGSQGNGSQQRPSKNQEENQEDDEGDDEEEGSQNNVSQNQASQNKASQNKASQNKASQNKASQNQASQNKSSQNQNSQRPSNRGGELKKDPNMSNKDTSQFK